MGEKVFVESLPICDVCGLELAGYDARTVFGSWANLCEKDWRRYGIGQLGTGYGQQLFLMKSED